MSILDINKRCFQYLLNYKVEGKTLFFVPRRKNNNHKLEKGYYFLGNDDYLHISFWIGQDTKEKIHSIGFVVKEDKISVEISSRDNLQRANLLRKLVAILNSETELFFKEIRQDKWEAVYATKDPIENLDKFILNTKPIIDKFIKEQQVPNMTFVDGAFYKKYVKGIEEKYL